MVTVGVVPREVTVPATVIEVAANTLPFCGLLITSVGGGMRKRVTCTLACPWFGGRGAIRCGDDNIVIAIDEGNSRREPLTGPGIVVGRYAVYRRRFARRSR